MGWVMMIWTLKVLGTLLNVLGSFKALKQKPKRVTALARVEGSRPKQLTTADRARRRAIRSQLITWTCWILVLKLEPTADRVGALVPLYDELKLILLLALIVLRQPVALLIFDQLLTPLITPYEAPLDALGYALGQLVNLTLFALLWPAQRVLRWWRGPREADVPAILAGLRAPNRPSLARDLADAVERNAQVDARFAKSGDSSPPSTGGAGGQAQAAKPRRAPAKVAKAGGSVAKGAGRSASVAARASAKASGSTPPLSKIPARDAATKAAASARAPVSTETAPLYPSLAVVPRPKGPPASTSTALARRDEAQAVSLLASLPPAPSTALVTYIPRPPPAAQQERVTLAIPPPPRAEPEPEPSPPPPPPRAPEPTRVAAPTPFQPFKPVRSTSSSYASSLTDTPLPPGSFFGARPKPTPPPAAAAATPPATRTAVDSPARKRASVGGAVAATPRQKALSAIADLSPKLGEDELSWGKRPAKKAKVSPVARTTRRARKAAEEDGEYEEEQEAMELPKRKKVATGLARSTTRKAAEEADGQGPRKKAAVGNGVSKAGARLHGEEEEEGEEGARPRKKAATGVTRSATRSALAGKAATKRKPSAEMPANSDPDEADSTQAPPSTRARPASLETASSTGRRSRASTLAERESSPPATASSETFSLPVPKRKGKASAADAVAGGAPVAPARKARRVALGTTRGGVGVGSDEEIDGVPVARSVGVGRRSAKK